MRMEDVNARRAYIKSVRKSFDSPQRNYEWEENKSDKGEAADGFSFFKVRLLISVFIFAAYILCDQTNTLFYHFSTREIAQKIEESYDLKAAEEKVQEVFSKTTQTIRMR